MDAYAWLGTVSAVMVGNLLSVMFVVFGWRVTRAEQEGREDPLRQPWWVILFGLIPPAVLVLAGWTLT